MPRNYKRTSSNKRQVATANKSKDKSTYKIIVLGSGGVGKVSLDLISKRVINGTVKVSISFYLRFHLSLNGQRNSFVIPN